MIRKSFFLLMLLALAGAAAHAAPVQRIRQIQRPLMNLPAIVKPGDSFELAVAPPQGQPLGAAFIYGTDDPAVRVALSLDAGTPGDGLVIYKATVPANAAPGLYDLSALFPHPDKIEDDWWDRQPHAVKVVREFKSEYDFIQITDIHFNVQDIKGRDMNSVRRKVLQMASALNPEFILFSGDMGLNPQTYDADYVYGYEEWLQWLRAPLFMTPGNHELYYTDKDGLEIDGLDYWTAAYGPTHYSFNYGPLHVVGISTFDWPRRWRNRYSHEAMFAGTVINAYIAPPQWNWLKADLEAAAARGQKCVANTHIPIGTLQGGKKIGIPPNTEKMPGPNPDQLAELLAANNCSDIFIGHMHFNKENQWGALKETLTRSAGISIGNDPDFKWGFRVIHVKDGAVTGSDIVEIGLDAVGE